MWYDIQMQGHPIQPEIQKAEAAIQYAQWVREHHRRRTNKGNPQREADLKNGLKQIKSAMKPLRTYLGQARWKEQTPEHLEQVVFVKELSQRLQTERRKLWKMKNKKKKSKEYYRRQRQKKLEKKILDAFATGSLKL